MPEYLKISSSQASYGLVDGTIKLWLAIRSKLYLWVFAVPMVCPPLIRMQSIDRISEQLITCVGKGGNGGAGDGNQPHPGVQKKCSTPSAKFVFITVPSRCKAAENEIQGKKKKSAVFHQNGKNWPPKAAEIRKRSLTTLFCMRFCRQVQRRISRRLDWWRSTLGTSILRRLTKHALNPHMGEGGAIFKKNQIVHIF